jgi:uncharacterized membrane protein
MEGLLVLLAVAVGIVVVILPIVSVILLSGLRTMINGLAEDQSRLLAELRGLRGAVRESEPHGEAEPFVPEHAEPAVAQPAAPAPIVEHEPVAAPAMVPERTRVPPPLPPPLPVPEPAPAFAEAGHVSAEAVEAVEPPAWSVEPMPPPEPGRIEIALRKAWAWILMGGEDRLKGHTREFAIASWWLLVAGVAVVVLCAGYFLKLAFDHGWIGPEGRVGIAALFGVAMLVSGLRMLGRKYHLIGQGFLGGGLLILYFAAYSATSMYKIIPIEAGFTLMALVTLGAGVLSVRTDSMLVAFIGLAGGFITPLMLRTPTPNLPGLYAYILLLDLGVMGVARKKDWPALNYVAFVLTYALFWGSMPAYRTNQFPMAMTFLALFFAVHSWVCYVRTVMAGRPSTIPDVIHLALNGAVFAGCGYWLIREAYGRPYPVFLALSLAAFYTLHIVLFLDRGKADKRLLVTLLALAGAFTTWALPLVLEKETLSIAIALLAFMFLWMGGRIRSGFLQTLGHVLYMVVFWRFLVLDLNAGYRPAATAGVEMSLYWKEMSGRMLTFGITIGSAVAAFLLERRQGRMAGEPEANPERDTGRAIQPAVGAAVFFWSAVALVFIVFHRELTVMFSFWRVFQAPAITFLWCAMAAFFLANLVKGRWHRATMFILLCVFLLAASVKVLTVDMESWRLTGRWVYAIDYGWRQVTARTLDFFGVIGVGIAAALLAGVRRNSRAAVTVFGYGSLAMFFIFSTLETKTMLWFKLPTFRDGGVSVLWALFAIAFVGVGIWKNIKTLRYLGLLLFVVVLGKVFLSDLSRLSVMLRVIAFMIVGVALLLGSFAYLYAGRKFSNTDPAEDNSQKTEDGKQSG